jgi:hypothetical protein
MIYIVHNLHFQVAAEILDAIIPPHYTGSKTLKFQHELNLRGFCFFKGLQGG